MTMACDTNAALGYWIERARKLERDVDTLTSERDGLKRWVAALQDLCKAQHFPMDVKAWCDRVAAIDAALKG